MSGLVAPMFSSLACLSLRPWHFDAADLRRQVDLGQLLLDERHVADVAGGVGAQRIVLVGSSRLRPPFAAAGAGFAACSDWSAADRPRRGA